MPVSRQLIYWLFVSSKGGLNRAKIILSLREKPMNLHRLAEKMNLHYTTAEHHVKLLAKHGFLVTTGDDYGKVYFLSQDLEDSYGEFERITKKIK